MRIFSAMYTVHIWYHSWAVSMPIQQYLWSMQNRRVTRATMSVATCHQRVIVHIILSATVVSESSQVGKRGLVLFSGDVQPLIYQWQAAVSRLFYFDESLGVSCSFDYCWLGRCILGNFFGFVQDGIFQSFCFLFNKLKMKNNTDEKWMLPNVKHL